MWVGGCAGTTLASGGNRLDTGLILRLGIRLLETDTSGSRGGGGVLIGVRRSAGRGERESIILSGLGDMAIGVGICGVVVQVGDGVRVENKN